MPSEQPLSHLEKSVYEWQMWVDDFGEAGQRKLKGASVLISRCGGLGGMVALELAAAGVGRLILAHAGNLKPSDLNRQILMSHDWLGRPRVECAARRLRALNPRLEVVAVAENVSESNAGPLVRQADVVVDCAPRFEERFALNRQAVQQAKPMVECAMYELQAQITTILPGQTPCLACLSPEAPANWRRQFPVFGAVSGMVGCLGAMEVIKLLTGLGDVLAGRLLTCDLRTMSFRTLKVKREMDCRVCGPTLLLRGGLEADGLSGGLAGKGILDQNEDAQANYAPGKGSA
jgi:molybdopterin/thiamine biosynthesis adenylyltransferase